MGLFNFFPDRNMVSRPSLERGAVEIPFPFSLPLEAGAFEIADVDVDVDDDDAAAVEDFGFLPSEPEIFFFLRGGGPPEERSVADEDVVTVVVVLDEKSNGGSFRFWPDDDEDVLTELPPVSIGVVSTSIRSCAACSAAMIDDDEEEEERVPRVRVPVRVDLDDDADCGKDDDAEAVVGGEVPVPPKLDNAPSPLVRRPPIETFPPAEVVVVEEEGVAVVVREPDFFPLRCEDVDAASAKAVEAGGDDDEAEYIVAVARR